MTPTDPVDALVVRAVDELDEHHAITDETWAALGEHFDDEQRLDLSSPSADTSCSPSS